MLTVSLLAVPPYALGDSAPVSEADREIVDNLHILQHMDVLQDFELLEEMDLLEGPTENREAVSLGAHENNNNDTHAR